MIRRPLLVLAIFVGLSSHAHADQLTPADLARKNDGGYVTGLPLAAYTTDLGLGLGARAYYFWNGHRADPQFARSPYLYRVFLQAFASTRGIQFHWLDLDAPRLLGSPYRVRGQLILMRNTSSNYFGLGKGTLEPLRFPGSGEAYGSYDAYARDQARVDGDGQTWARYDQYDLLRPIALASIERLFLDDRVRVLAGIGATYARVHDYSGRQVDAVDGTGQPVQARQAATRLASDCATGRVVGCRGGRDDYLRLGLSYDTRDYEPDPNSGVFVDAALDLGTVALGSQFDYVRALVAARAYWSPAPDTADLVVAGRVALVGQTNGAPFFSLDVLPFTDDPRTGLGGHRTLRGFRQNRFVGSVLTLANAELRWTFGHAEAWGQRFGFIIAPFVDAGRPYDALGELSLRGWRPSYGGAVRISWNLATLVTADYGVSGEDAGLYVNFNHIF